MIDLQDLKMLKLRKSNNKRNWNGIKRGKAPNKYSLKKIAQINGEVPARLALCKRAGGKPIIKKEIYRRNDGTRHKITRVFCIGGKCECGCKKPANNINGQLFPHEKLWRGRGGKLSLVNSILILNSCHRRLQNREPKLKWIKEAE